MIDKSIEVLGHSKQTFRPVFIKSAEIIRNVVENDLRNAKRELSKCGVRIIEEHTDSRSSKRWRIIQRGHEEVMEMLRPTIERILVSGSGYIMRGYLMR